MLAAISPLSAGLVDGPVRVAGVLGVFPTALYLSVRWTGGEEVLPVVTSDGLQPPTAVRLPVPSGSLAEVGWGVAIGGTVSVGDGRIDLPSLGGISVVRQWRPSRVPRRPDASADTGWSPFAAARLVTGRIGLGPGLTPEGDDELCGALLVAHALFSGSNPLRDSVFRALGRTTSLSASLLRAAGDGYAVPELAAYVIARLDGRDDPGLRECVAAIGHSSGPALLRGVDLGLALAPSTDASTSARQAACA